MSMESQTDEFMKTDDIKYTTPIDIENKIKKVKVLTILVNFTAGGSGIHILGIRLESGKPIILNKLNVQKPPKKPKPKSAHLAYLKEIRTFIQTSIIYRSSAFMFKFRTYGKNY